MESTSPFIVVLLLISLWPGGWKPLGIGGGNETPLFALHLLAEAETEDTDLDTLAVAFQSWMYGRFTPAGGVFATFASLGMLGWIFFLSVAASAVVGPAVVDKGVGGNDDDDEILENRRKGKHSPPKCTWISSSSRCMR